MKRTKATIGSRGCRHIHLAYVPLMRREASTCMHADNAVDNAYCHEWLFGCFDEVLVTSELLTPNTEEKSMWCDSPSCSVDSSPGPTDCSERFCAAVCAISRMCGGQVLVASRSEAHKNEITRSRTDRTRVYPSFHAASCQHYVQWGLHTTADFRQSILNAQLLVSLCGCLKRRIEAFDTSRSGGHSRSLTSQSQLLDLQPPPF